MRSKWSIGLLLVLVTVSFLFVGGFAKGHKEGGHLVVGEYWEPNNLDPHVSDSRHMMILNYQIFDALLVNTPDGEIHPHLAKDWEVSNDGLHYTFHLREDVTFHDGTKFDAEAVKYNFERILDPDVGSLMLANQLSDFESAEVLDEYTVRINFSEPVGSFLWALASWRIGMVSPKAAKEKGPEDFGFEPVGTGPFEFVEWVPQEKIVLKRNEDYDWAPQDVYDHQGPAYLEKVTIRYITEDATRTAALETGEVDISIRPQPYQVQKFRDNPDYKVRKDVVPGLPTTFVLNTDKEPLTDPKVRRALNLWLNRKKIVESVYAGEFPPAYGPLSPETFGFSEEAAEMNKMDRDKAQELLAEAGWEDEDDDGVLEKNGEEFELKIYSCGDYKKPPESIEPQFRAMGADTEIVMVPWSQQKRTVYEGKPHMMVATFNNIDPRVLRLLFHSENFGESGWFWSHLHESNPVLQERINTLLEVGDRVTDMASRKRIYQNVQELIVENGIALPVRVDNYIFAMDENIEGWKKHVGGWPLFYDMWIND